MLENEDYKNIQEALDIEPKEVDKLIDGKKDIYRFRKANPKIYIILLIGIFVIKSGMTLKHLKQIVAMFHSIKGDE